MVIQSCEDETLVPPAWLRKPTSRWRCND